MKNKPFLFLSFISITFFSTTLRPVKQYVEKQKTAIKEVITRIKQHTLKFNMLLEKEEKRLKG